jgi:LuxR family maltose regulon positive regulatory protein
MTSTISEPIFGREARDARTTRRPRLEGTLIERQHAIDKLRVPAPNVRLLHRHRVTRLIEHATASRVTVVTGPTGAGKTIACATWAAGTSDVAWISLDQGNRQPARLWADVCSALSCVPAAARVISDLPDPADQAFSLRLAQAARVLPAPVTVVIDDIQALADSPALADLEFLVRRGPASLRLLLAGRHLGGLGVARLRVGGELAEIGAGELACTPQEAEAYFAMHGVDLSPAELAELLRRTQGWITGLRLACMRCWPGETTPLDPPRGGQGQAHGAPWRISGDEPHVADYLRDEVLATLPAGYRDFLLRTCVVDRVCGDLADALTASTDGAAILDQLCRENVMLRRTGEDGGSSRATAPGGAEYQYHPLLVDLLRAQLRRELPAELPSLTRRAARWQAARGDHADALRNAARSGDWDFASMVLAKAGPELLLASHAAALEPVLATFPASRYASEASVAGALAAAGLRTGDISATQSHLDNASAALSRCPGSVRLLVSTWLLALRLMHATTSGKANADLIEQGVTVASQAASTICGDAEHQALGLLWNAIGVAALSRLRVADAREATAQACKHLRDAGHAEFLANAVGWRAVAEAMYGDLLTASELIGEIRKHADEATAQAPWWLADLASAYLHLAKDETASARRLLDPCASDSRGRGYEASVITSLTTVAKARIALCEGDQATARRLATSLRYQGLKPADGAGHGSTGHGGGQTQPRGRIPAATYSCPTAIDSALAMLDADIALGEGNVSGARLALARATDNVEPDRADLLLGSAKVLLAEGDSAAALAKAETCLAGTATQITLRDQVSALVTAAVARRRLGQADQAADQLGYALALAEPHGLYRPFLDGGSAARSALTVLIRPANQGAAVAARILRRFDTRPGRQPDAPAAVPLTGSELAVLRFLPSHMTNQEIAESLFLSINTVKTHLRSVYRKLGVTTRRQAISSAGRLGLL